MCMYHKVGYLGVVAGHSTGLYIICTTKKLVIHTANIVYTEWSKWQVLQLLLGGVMVVAIKCVGVNIHCTTPKSVLLLSTII